jgi:hypothetical protein
MWFQFFVESLRQGCIFTCTIFGSIIGHIGEPSIQDFIRVDEATLYTREFYAECAERKIDRCLLGNNYYRGFIFTSGVQEEAIAVCRYFRMGLADTIKPLTVVAFVRAEWDMLAPIQRKALVFHELGHCILNLAHTPDSTPQLREQYRGHIMNSHMASVRELMNWNYRVNELFAYKVRWLNFLEEDYLQNK